MQMPFFAGFELKEEAQLFYADVKKEGQWDLENVSYELLYYLVLFR